MFRIFIIAALAVSAFGADRQYLITPSSHVATLTVPANAVTSNAYDWRMEAWCFSPTTVNSYWLNMRPPSNAAIGIGITALTGTNRFYVRHQSYLNLSGSGQYTGVTLNSTDNYFVRIQRKRVDASNTKISVESWNFDGTGYQVQESSHYAITDPSIAGAWELGGTYGAAAMPLRVGFFKVFSTVLPLASAKPKSSNAGDIVDFAFNGSIVDSGPYALTWSIPGATYGTISLTWPDPTADAGADQTISTGITTLNGSGSHSNDDDNPALTYYWSQVSGPTTVRWTGRSVASPGVAGLIGGVYRFRLTVTDASGSTSYDDVVVTIFPGRASSTGTAAVGFILPSGATSARCSIMSQFGSWVTSSTVTASPCLFTTAPDKLAQEYIKIEFLNSGGSVVSTRYGGTVVEPQPVLSHASFLANPYAWEYEGSTFKQTLRTTWYPQRYDVVVGGGVGIDGRDSVANPGAYSTYLDSAFGYDPNYYLRQHAEELGIQLDDALVHLRYDNQCTGSGNHPWLLSDMFDKFECSGRPCTAASQASKGVFLDGADVTSAAYTGGTHTVNTALLIGNGLPFDELNFVITTAAAAAPAWQFWNGTEYATLTLASDTTSGMTTSGKIRFQPPPTWARKVESGSLSKYWVRMVPGSGTKPIFSTVKGDNWTVASGSNNARGWDPTAAGRVNVGLGELEYNSSPPDNARAKFRHQGRATCHWASGAVFYCYGCTNGDGTINYGGELIARETERSMKEHGNLRGWMWDDSGGNPFFLNTPTYVEFAAADWFTKAKAGLLYAKNRLKSWYPGALAGGNTNSWGLARAVGYDWALGEGEVPPWIGVDAYSTDPSGAAPNEADRITFAKVDNPAVNTTGLRWYPFCGAGLYSYQGHVWNRVRSSMNCIAAYYMGVSATNVRQSGINVIDVGRLYHYDETNQYYYLHTGTTLTGAVTAGADAVSIPVASTSGCEIANTLLYGAGIYLLQIGAHDAPDNVRDVVTATKSGNTFTSGYYMTRVLNNYPSGTAVHCINPASLSTSDPTTRTLGIYRYSNWVPAMGVDIGRPTGPYTRFWKDGTHTAVGGIVTNTACTGVSGATRCGTVSRRDFSGGPYGNVIVLLRGWHEYGIAPGEVYTYSASIDLSGTWYPLLHTGKTGSAITTIQLRGAESAILLERPIE